MAGVIDYRVGDRVTHSTCGPGTVTRVVLNSDSDDWRERGVHVSFDQIGKNGKPWGGVYDDTWFRTAGCRLTRIEDGADATPPQQQDHEGG